MANEELPQPGVEVVQVFRATSPSVITPTLLSCVVGVCKQIVEVYETNAAGSSSLNGDALIQLPAFFEAPAGPYTGLHGANLVFSANYGPNITVVFDDPLITGLSAATVVSQVNAALTAQSVTSVTAELVGSDRWRLRSVGVGEFQTLYIDPSTTPVCQTAFAIGLGKMYQGLTGYNQYEVVVPETNFPDPNSNLDELAIESSSIRAFMYTGESTSLYEAMRDAAFLRNGVVDDAATVTGATDITQATNPLWYAPAGTLDGTDFNIQFEGGAVINVNFIESAGHLVDETTLIARIMALVTDIQATIEVTGELTLTSLIAGYPGSFTVSAGTVDALAILDPTSSLVGTHNGNSIEAVDDGNGDAVTPILEFANEDFTAAPTQAVASGTGPIAVWPAAGETLILSDGKQEQTITFLGTEVTIAGGAPDLKTAIEAVLGTAAGGKLTVTDVGGVLTITHSDFGTDSQIHVIGGTYLANSLLAAGTYRPTAMSLPEPGDELWIDGAYYGLITQVAPGGLADRLKVDSQVTISPNVGAYFYIVAKNLPGSATRPDPELTIDLYGNAILKPEMLRDMQGDPVVSNAPLYLTYTALRLDVTSRASNPGLLKMDSTTDIEDAIPPITTDNPLALGMYFASVNAPGSQVTGLGVDEVSADAPYGTVEGFTRAAEYLEAFEVYAIAPLTHDESVAQVFNTHVTFMSEPSNKGERIVLWNPDMPSYARDTLIASGNDGNSSGPTGLLFDTKVTNLTTLVLAEGINPTGVIPVSEGLYLDIASDSKRYSVAGISGSTITIRTSFAAGENDDSYYSTTALNASPLPAYLVQEQFSIKVRGAELVTVAGDVDRNAIADNIQATGRVFQNRRFWMVVPDQTAATVGGVETVMDGFYMCAGIVGMISQQPPQQSFTNFPMSGFTRVIGSNDSFSRSQLNRMAAGGAYIIVQEAEGAPLTARMALTTDMTSIETRTDSITKVVDMTAKFQRTGLKNFIGRFNITQGFLDSLGTVLDGLTTFLTDIGVLIGANVNNIIQDEDTPDTVLIDETVDVPYPCNYIRLTITV